MFDFHKDKLRYFEMQKTVTSDDIIPFIEEEIGACTSKFVLEIGCAEAGVLKAFIDHGNIGVGVELSESRFKTASHYLSEDIALQNATIINKNIYDIHDVVGEFGRPFDVIILKDVIEHIPNQEKFISKLKDFLSQDGIVFFAYPPWFMPFGGHQQICNHKLLRSFPWIHLLPTVVYKAVLKIFNEKEQTISELLEVKSTGINIGHLKSLITTSGFQIKKEIFWLINPIYQMKFGYKKRQVSSFLTKIPILRNFYTTAHYILFKAATPKK